MPKPSYYNSSADSLRRYIQIFDEFIMPNINKLKLNDAETAKSLRKQMEIGLTDKQLSLCEVMYEKMMKVYSGESVTTKHDFKKKY